MTVADVKWTTSSTRPRRNPRFDALGPVTLSTIHRSTLLRSVSWSTPAACTTPPKVSADDEKTADTASLRPARLPDVSTPATRCARFRRRPTRVTSASLSKTLIRGLRVAMTTSPWRSISSAAETKPRAPVPPVTAQAPRSSRRASAVDDAASTSDGTKTPEFDVRTQSLAAGASQSSSSCAAPLPQRSTALESLSRGSSTRATRSCAWNALSDRSLSSTTVCGTFASAA
mmetsp:Transcript_9315/g.31957  ORF Transcript_9315/g.31957 Transcript_9315/m.31957 type:complete len:230 (+) Transcript_9315:1542-2231(+)